MCDRDCFNCKYPDCICDELSEEERKASSRLDSYAKNPDGEEHRAYKRLDYQKHREKRLKSENDT